MEIAVRDRGDLLHRVFERQVDLRPQAVAVECGGREITYLALDQAANRLAHFLRSRGVEEGHRVAFQLPRSPEVYVALLAILKCGAAYVPLDPEYPAERVAYILSDSGASAWVTFGASVGSIPFQGELVLLDVHGPEIERSPSIRLPELIRTGPADLCYVIYTSGSTGRPKGVELEHRNACNLVEAERELYGATAEDRVFQGFSIAFDASVEEVWMPFRAGGTLVVGTHEMVRAGAELAAMLTAARVTILSCVPTLLSMITDDLPTVRVLILGGEECPRDLVARWYRPGRRVFNTYGPTEATVIATALECSPERPVTIGKPISGYRAVVLGPDLREVPLGEVGELCLGGVGLARGYVNRPELTQARFIEDSTRPGTGERLYRTGDLARELPTGEFEYLGRIDSQVKIRGYRVELTEIEEVLRECPGVLSAVVALRDDIADVPQLVAYCVPREGQTLDPSELRSRLRAKLPAYMVPMQFESIDVLPTLPSGKIDRKSLPAPRARTVAETDANPFPPRTPREQALADLWRQLFAPLPVSIRDDFFLDLGGHSLLAARMVSELRKDPMFSGLSVLDVYKHPTIEQLAHQFEASAPDVALAEREPFAQVPTARFLTCAVFQAIALYFVLGFFSMQWLAPYLTYSWMLDEGYELGETLLAALCSLVAVYPCMLAFGLAVKWLVIGRYRAGRYPLWGAYYFRWWFVNSMLSSIPIDYLGGTPLLGVYYRLMGAKIGRNVHLGDDCCATFDLVSIGDDTCIGSDVSLTGYTIENGWLKLGRVDVGASAFVGVRTVVREDAHVGAGARVEDLSYLPRGTQVPAGEVWRGSPARKVGNAEPVASSRPAWGTRFGWGLAHAAGVVFVPLFVVGAIFPGMMLMSHLNEADDYYYYLVVSPLVAFSFVVLLALEIAAMKWLLLGRVRAGSYPRRGLFYWKKRFVDQLLELSLDVLGPLYSTIYLAPWYRLLGAKLGRRAEISTASFISPDLLDIGDEGFIADCVSLGAPRVEGGTMTVAGTKIGKRSFIGNSALLPPGTEIGDECLIGCLSSPPGSRLEASRPGGAWLGSPSFHLPQRQQSHAFPIESTFEPTRKLWIQRAVIEAFRVLLPSTCFIAITSVLLSAVIVIREYVELYQLILMFPFLYAICGVVAAGIVVACKWVLMGTYRPTEQPLWSTFVWRTEFITAMHEGLADIFLTNKLVGTPYLAWFFRALGAKIGRRVYIETTAFTEFDLVDIGDDVALNLDSTVQTHLFEDRVMKMSHIRIGDRCSVGSLSLVLYDTRIEPGAILEDLSLLMKGEVLPPNTRWRGIPAIEAPVE